MHTTRRSWLEGRRANLQTELAEIESELASLKTIGKWDHDPYANGVVLRIHKRFGKTPRATTYVYAAVKACDLWHLTGSTTPFGDCDPMSWEELAEFVEGCSVELLTTMTTVQEASRA